MRGGKWYTFREGRIVRVVMKNGKGHSDFVCAKDFRKVASVEMVIYHKAKSAQ